MHDFQAIAAHHSNKHHKLIIALGLIFLLMQLPPAHAEKVQLYFAHTAGPGSLYDASANEFAKRANAKLPDSYRVVVVGSSGLGDDTAVLEKLKRGEVTMSLPSTAMSTVSDTFGIFELPFLIRDRAQMQRVSPLLLSWYLQPAAHKKGYRILAIWENGFRHITNNIRPIRRPEDLRGLKIRIPPGPWREKLFRMLGAIPVPMPIHQVYESLSAGTVDGQENPLQQIKGSKFTEVQRYLTYSEHIYTPAYVLVGEAAFALLPVAVQQILATTATEMQSWVYDYATRLESALVDEFEEVVRINQLDIKAFETATRPLYGEFIRTVEGGGKMVTIVTGLTARDDARGATPSLPNR
jgi:tripartite ATP-independent transporter DctP family solute receptor